MRVLENGTNEAIYGQSGSEHANPVGVTEYRSLSKGLFATVSQNRRTRTYFKAECALVVILFMLVACQRSESPSGRGTEQASDSIDEKSVHSAQRHHSRRLLEFGSFKLDDRDFKGFNWNPACQYNTPPPALPGKRGIGLTLRDTGDPKGGTWNVNRPKLLRAKPFWNYSWGTKRRTNQPRTAEFVPMVWGGWGGMDGTQATMNSEVYPEIVSGKVKRLMGFNEPDSPKQASMSVEQALQMWPVLESMGVPLVSPATVDPTGAWMTEFMTKANERCLRIDYIAVHWYGSPNVEAFKSQMAAVYAKFGNPRPLLITEFAPADWSATTRAGNRFTPSMVLSFMKEVLPWMEQQNWIAGYAWFSFPIASPVGYSSALFLADGQLTQLGKFYASVSAKQPYGNRSIYY
jgi:Glycosyl hydrolase catalytic core